MTASKLASPFGVQSSLVRGPIVIRGLDCPPGSPCSPLRHVLTSVHLRLKYAAKVLLLGSATFTAADGSAGTATSVELGPIVPSLGTDKGTQSGHVAGTTPLTLTFQHVVFVAAGEHIVDLEADVTNETTTPAVPSVDVTAAQLVAVVLPSTP